MDTNASRVASTTRPTGRADGNTSRTSGATVSSPAVSPPPHGFSHGAFGSHTTTSRPFAANSSATRAPAGPPPMTPTSAYAAERLRGPFCARLSMRHRSADALRALVDPWRPRQQSCTIDAEMPPRRWKPIAVEAALAVAVLASAGLWFGIHGPQRAAHEIAALGDHTSTRILFTALYATGLAIGLPVGSLSVVGGAEFGFGLGFA